MREATDNLFERSAMPRSIKPEQMADHFRSYLPEGIAPLYHALSDEVSSLNVAWNSYVELYGRGESRIDLLNHVAPSFFDYLESALLEDILLSLMRLTDPPKSAGRSNLTLRRLGGKLQHLGYPKVAEEVAVAVESLVTNIEAIREYRNRQLSREALI